MTNKTAKKTTKNASIASSDSINETAMTATGNPIRVTKKAFNPAHAGLFGSCLGKDKK